LTNVENALLQDLTGRVFLQVPTTRRKYVDNEQLFGADVYRQFPSARIDVCESGNCLAADCGTAAVFHMMRAVEWGLRSLCVHLGFRQLKCKNKKTGKVTYKPISYQQWETILSQLQSRMETKLQNVRGGPKKQAWQEFYFPAVQDINAFREAFRNHVMHARRVYTATEAEAVKDRVERFMRLLATRVAEA